MFFDRYTYEITPWLRTEQRVLLAMIVAGLLLLATQMFWVPPLVSYLMQHEQASVDTAGQATQLNYEGSELNRDQMASTTSVSIEFGEVVSSSKVMLLTVPDRVPADMTKQCVVGGCSGQLCTDDPTMMSTCEYRPEYACYASASCTRQETGECGWTATPELSACLLDTAAIR